MSISITTTEQENRCLELLRAACEPIVAADIATRLILPGSRETQRRHVRAIVANLRKNGAMIIGILQGGYFLTDDKKLYTEYLEGRKIDAKRILGVANKRKKMLTDNQGQGQLFEQNIHVGCATMAMY